MRHSTLILVKGLQRYQRSKLGFEKNVCRSARFEPMSPGSAELADILFELQLWPLISLHPLDQNQCLVLHLKVLFHICWEIKVQRFWRTFMVCNLDSNYPYLLHKMDSLMHTTVVGKEYGGDSVPRATHLQTRKSNFLGPLFRGFMCSLCNALPLFHNCCHPW